MNIIEVVQGTDEWRQARAGKVTASRIEAVLSRARGSQAEGAHRRNYKAQIIAEILTGRPQESGYSNEAMENGQEQQPMACGAYELLKGTFVEQVGLVLHPKIKRAAASPDGLVGADGMVEFKCPYPATHIGYMLAGVVPSKYEPQMLWGMACAERAWCDFASYCPAFPAPLNLFVVRLPRDDKRLIEITAEVTIFLREVDEIIERLTRKAAA